jgi:hypothetical protein
MVLRAFLTEEGLETVSTSEARNYIEAAVPVNMSDGGILYMTLFGVNAPQRSIRRYRPDFEPHVRIDPAMRVALARENGCEFVLEIPQDQISHIARLWVPTFGWVNEGIPNLATRMRAQTANGLRPSVWFSGLIYENQLVSAAMAEELRLPLGGGQSVSVIESTEWCTRPDASRLGFMSATVGYLHAQVVDSMRNSEHPRIVIAETNIYSGAHFVGNAVGMEVPPRQIGSLFVPQTLVQNVEVGDGIMPAGLRDFSMMYLTQQNIDTHYSADAISRMLGKEIV